MNLFLSEMRWMSTVSTFKRLIQAQTTAKSKFGNTICRLLFQPHLSARLAVVVAFTFSAVCACQQLLLTLDCECRPVSHLLLISSHLSSRLFSFMVDVVRVQRPDHGRPVESGENLLITCKLAHSTVSARPGRLTSPQFWRRCAAGS